MKKGNRIFVLFLSVIFHSYKSVLGKIQTPGRDLLGKIQTCGRDLCFKMFIESFFDNLKIAIGLLTEALFVKDGKNPKYAMV